MQSNGDPVGITQQGQSLRMLQQIVDGVNGRVGQPKALNGGLGAS